MELLSTLLLAFAAVAVAWAGFQSAKWGGVQAASTMQAGAAHTESVRASTLAGQQTQIDVSTSFIWVEAVVDDIDNGLVARSEQISRRSRSGAGRSHGERVVVGV